MVDKIQCDLASGLSEWVDNHESKFEQDHQFAASDLLQHVRLNVTSSDYALDQTSLCNGWASKNMPLPSHFTWENLSPPISHIGTPTEDFHQQQNQPFSLYDTCSPLQMPPRELVTTAVTPPVQPVTSATAVQPIMSIPPLQTQALEQFKLSTMSDTPTPSPSSDDDSHSTSSSTSNKHSGNEVVEELSLCKSKQEILKLIPKDVRVPQRKGNMQLWQFLYAILEDQIDIIEWTSNKKEYEFRLLQPDVVAIWWGHQKNRQNMNYDKLSRSLRYYYNRKIITKVNSERYVYRFCCNPELLYSVLGNSHTKPKLKEMPFEAKQMLEWNQGISGATNHVSLNPQLLKAPSPSHINPPINYIHSQDNDIFTGATSSDSISISYSHSYYSASKPQDSLFMPPEFYYTHCNSYPPPVMPLPPYPPMYPTGSVGIDWEQCPMSL